MDNIALFVAAPSILLQLVISGILVGAIFALVAYGMALVWGVLQIINVAQGEMVIFGGYLTYTLYYSLGIHPILTIPIVAITLYVFGWALYKTIIYKLMDKDVFITILACFGISILMQQLMDSVFGPDVVSADPNMGTQFWFDSTVMVTNIQLVSFVIAVCSGGLLFYLMKYSRMGQAIRATSQNNRAARILGINIEVVYANTYAINAAICGIAGSLVAMVWVLHPFIGLTYTIRSFMIVVIAGLGNFLGVIFAGMGIGALEVVAGFVLGAEFQMAFMFTLLVVVLVTRSIMYRRRREYLE